ncbi:MAG: DUF2191 domain-containing protein [Parvularculaceae bacterium]
MTQAKKAARERGTTVTALIEEGLRTVVAARPAVAKRRVDLPVSSAVGGLLPGINPVKLLAYVDELDDLERYGARLPSRAAP